MQLLLNQALVSLREPTDQPKGYLEVVDIFGVEGQNPSIPVTGLPGVSHLQISSWILQTELNSVRSQNPHIHFCTGAV
ncbi:hypothetical protein [Methanosarcina sp. UBA289]|uniref:hypothetical protein n=1 Tax=Methanosarcina sp. UBA289 TaxID=1915574 RepID=UPI0025F5B1F0|nr:hypothetical protein [Methanosarcina sp. UBA289]